jgi:predicted MFS family arabinose efflux permease
MLFTVKIPRYPGTSSPAASSRTGTTGDDSIWQSLKLAVRFALSSPVLVGLLYITIIMNALGFPIQQFVPDIGRDYLGKESVLVGLLVASEGFGQLIGALSLASMRDLRHPGRIFVVGSVALLITAMLFVWSPWYALTFALLTIGGTGQAGFSAMQSSVTMLSSPPEMRGRMMGVLSICIGAGIPLGALEIGAVASAFDTQWAISINALVGLLLILPAIALTPLVWRSFIPHPPPQQTQ